MRPANDARQSDVYLNACRAAAESGDSHALGNLLEVYKPYLRSIACRAMPAKLRGKFDDLDLVQETLLEAYLCLGRFKGQTVDDLRLWLRGILLRTLLDWVRRYCNTCKRALSREESLDAYADVAEPVDPHQTPCDSVIAQEIHGAVHAALACLTGDERLVIELRTFDRLSFREIGQRLRRSPEAARKLWSRAIIRLGGCLGGLGLCKADERQGRGALHDPG